MVDISIVTLSFNQVSFLGECINSVRENNDLNIEHIIVDPGSTDGSRSLIDQHESIVKVYEEDDGPADGLNKGFKLSSGKICAFLNADDYYVSGSLELIKKIFYEEDVDIVIAGGFVLKEGKKFYVKPMPISKNILLNGAGKIFQPGIFFKESIIKKYKFNKENRTCWDYEFLVDILQEKYKIKIIQEPVAYFRIHESSITGMNINGIEYKKDLDRIYQRETGKKRGFRYYIYNIYIRIINKLS